MCLNQYMENFHLDSNLPALLLDFGAGNVRSRDHVLSDSRERCALASGGSGPRPSAAVPLRSGGDGGSDPAGKGPLNHLFFAAIDTFLFVWGESLATGTFPGSFARLFCC